MDRDKVLRNSLVALVDHHSLLAFGFASTEELAFQLLLFGNNFLESLRLHKTGETVTCEFS